MKVCEKYLKNLVLYSYDDLENVERSELEAHLKICASCRVELHELQSMQKHIPQKPLIEPDDATLQLMRNAVSQKIREKTIKPVKYNSSRLFFYRIAQKPAFQVGFAVLLLTFGFFAGRGTVSGVDNSQLDFQNLIAANQLIQTTNSQINPLLAGVEKVKFNSSTGEVEIFYTTINDIQLNGNLDDPVIRQILSHAMLDEENPSVRLHAVKALQVFAEEEKKIKPELVNSLETLLDKENNLGIRLQALKLLNILPLNSSVKNILTKVLVHDSEPSMRIQAFDKLTSQTQSGEEMDEYLAIVKQDTSEYLKYRSKSIIDKLQQEENLNQEENNPVKIMRKEQQ